MNLWYIPACLIGYLLGSIPFALVIGKVFYQTDIRRAGSGNLGGGNAGRVLGKKAGLSVMTLDVLKVTLAIYIASRMTGGEGILIAAGMAAAVGHCFPVFAGFKGGKAVATMYGFLFGMAAIGGYGLTIFLFPLLAFLVILYLTKIIALASIGSALAVTLFLLIHTGFTPIVFALFVFTALIILRHRDNLNRIRNHQENKIKWM